MDRTASEVEEQYNRVVDFLADQADVIGLWLGGSRGKGFHDEKSDYDLMAVVEEDENAVSLRKKVDQFDLPDEIDVFFRTLSDLNNLTKWHEVPHWKRYVFADTRPLVDKTGELTRLIEKIGTFPSDRQELFINGALDAYLNAFYRSLKACGRDDKLAGLLEAGNAVEHLSAALFALHGMFKPHNDYLRYEIDKLSLPDKPDTFYQRILKIADTAEPAEQIRLKEDMEKLFDERGYQDVFAGWKREFRLLMNTFEFTQD